MNDSSMTSKIKKSASAQLNPAERLDKFIIVEQKKEIIRLQKQLAKLEVRLR